MMNRIAPFLLAAALVGPAVVYLSAPAAFAQDEGDEEAQKAYWQNRYRDLLKAVEATKLRLEEDRTAYTKGRQRGRLRGGERQEIVARIAENEKRLAELEQQLADFPTEARRAGVPPGWLRDVQIN